MGFRTSISRLEIPVNYQEFSAFREGPKVLANSFPKGGTNLLNRVLSLFPLLVSRWHRHMIGTSLNSPAQVSKIRKGQYVSAHFYWNEKLIKTLNNRDIRTLFIVRDLRDVVVSRTHYITHMLPGHGVSPYLNSLKSDEERLMAGIVGINQTHTRWSSIGDHARGYAGWLNEPTSLTVRFEDLIGSSGGESDEKQEMSVRAIASHLGIEVSENQITEIAKNAFFSKAKTFRKGQTGDWKNHFNDEHKRVFKEVAGEALIKFGYAQGYDW